MTRLRVLVAIFLCASVMFGAPIATQVSPDGLWRIELADDTPRQFGLYATPKVGPRRRISPDMAVDRDVILFAIAPDSARVVYTADPGTWTKYELFSVPIGGGGARKLSGPLPVEHDVDTFLPLTGGRVVYRQGRNTTGAWQLWSAPITGGAPLQLTTLPQGSQVGQALREVSRDRVLYQVETAGVKAWWLVPVAGGVPAAAVFVDGFDQGNTGGWSR